MAHTAGHRKAQMVNRQNAIKSKAGRKRAADRKRAMTTRRRK